MSEEQLRQLWDTIPDAGCLGLCAASCGPIGMSRLERELLERHHPVAFPHMDQMLVDFAMDPEGYHCPLLLQGRCRAYEDRPTICRLFGVDAGMPCPWGCVPEGGLMPKEEGSQILQRSLDLGGEDELL